MKRLLSISIMELIPGSWLRFTKNYIAYDLTNALPNKAVQIILCPTCHKALSTCSIQASLAVEKSLDNTEFTSSKSLLSTCEHCQWWCIREKWALFERNGSFDYLIIEKRQGKGKEKSAISLAECQPWQNALNDPKVYHGAKPLPNELVRIFR